MNKLFPKEDLQSVIYSDGPLILIEDTISDTSRWKIHHDVIFQDPTDGKYYQTTYSVGATEMQDERPFEFDEDMIVCEEVVKKQVVVEQWVVATE